MTRQASPKRHASVQHHANVALVTASLIAGCAALRPVAASPAAVGPASVRRTHPRPVAVAARELAVSESANLHLISHHHEVITEEGHGSGTLAGKVAIRLTLGFTQATVTFTTYPPGGTVAGRGEGSSYVQGNTAHFTGTASVTGGTGKYAHASGSGIRITGTLQRKTFAFAVHLEGKLRY